MIAPETNAARRTGPFTYYREAVYRFAICDGKDHTMVEIEMANDSEEESQRGDALAKQITDALNLAEALRAVLQ